MKTTLSLILLLLTIFNSAYASNVTNSVTIGKTLSVAGNKITSMNRVDGSFESSTTGWVASVGTIVRTASTEFQGSYKGVWSGTGTGTLDLQWSATASNTYDLNAQVRTADSDMQICAYVNGYENGCETFSARNITKLSKIASSWLGSSFYLRLKHTGSDAFSVEVDDGKIDPWSENYVNTVSQESFVATNNNGAEITAGVTDIPFITTESSTLSELGTFTNNTTYTAKRDQQVTVTARAHYSSASATNRGLELFKNGVGYLSGPYINASQAGSFGAFTLNLLAGEYFTLRELQTGGTLTSGSGDQAKISITAIASAKNLIRTWQDGTEWTTYSQTVEGSVSNPTKGTSILIDEAKYVFNKEGGADFYWTYNHNSSAVSGGSGIYLLKLPNSLVMDSTRVKFATTTDARGTPLGSGHVTDGSTDGISATNYPCNVYAYDSTRVKLVCHDQSASNLRTNRFNFATTGGPSFNGTSNLGIYVKWSVPIVGKSNYPLTYLVPASLDINNITSVSSILKCNSENIVTTATSSAVSLYLPDNLSIGCSINITSASQGGFKLYQSSTASQTVLDTSSYTSPSVSQVGYTTSKYGSVQLVGASTASMTVKNKNAYTSYIGVSKRRCFSNI